MTPVPISKAVEMFFPHGGVTKSTLFAAIRRGELACEKIGKAYMVTEADVIEWRKMCRKETKGQDSGLGNAKAEPPSTSSNMERSKSAQAAALMKANALTKPSPPILPPTSSPTPGNVTLLKSP